jgi:hypothetical protein
MKKYSHLKIIEQPFKGEAEKKGNLLEKGTSY